MEIRGGKSGEGVFEQVCPHGLNRPAKGDDIVPLCFGGMQEKSRAERETTVKQHLKSDNVQVGL